MCGLHARAQAAHWCPVCPSTQVPNLVEWPSLVLYFQGLISLLCLSVSSSIANDRGREVSNPSTTLRAHASHGDATSSQDYSVSVHSLYLTDCRWRRFTQSDDHYASSSPVVEGPSWPMHSTETIIIPTADRYLSDAEHGLRSVNESYL
jgi:hypothetical protein